MINLLFTWQTDLSISPGECDNCVLLVCVYRQTDRRTGTWSGRQILEKGKKWDRRTNRQGDIHVYFMNDRENKWTRNKMSYGGERNKVVILSHSIFPTRTNNCHKTERNNDPKSIQIYIYISVQLNFVGFRQSVKPRIQM